LWKIEQELKSLSQLLAQTRKKRPVSENLTIIDIVIIRAVGFKKLLQRQDNTIFATSLYKVNCIIKEKLTEQAKTDNQLIEQKLSAQYYSFKDVFSKTKSDQLLLYQEYNYKIQLEKENNLGFSSLYNHSAEELKAVKKYITENLCKGFITLS
jgi:hypothetical protein